jgi:hypothetical protein
MSISVSNNADGSFTVSCGTETVIIGAGDVPKAAPHGKKLRGRRGGFVSGIVVAGLVAGEKLPRGTIPVRDTDALMAKLKSKVSEAGTLGSAGKAKRKELHFCLDGLHTVDVAKVSAITGSESAPLVTHIHIGRGHV